jgi:hypothetical protein
MALRRLQSKVRRLAWVQRPKGRPRGKRPLLLTLFGAGFLLMPIGNYAARAVYKPIDPFDVAEVLRTFGILGGVLLVTSLLVGIGLLRVRPWGYRLFTLYAIALVAYDIYELVRNPVLYNVGAIAQTVFAFAAVAYFARKDIFTPYLAPNARGFRGEKRYAFESNVTIDGARRVARDISSGGCFVVWPACPKAVGDSIELEWGDAAGTTFTMHGTVARKDDGGIGVAYDVQKRSPESLRIALSAKWRVKGD